MSAQPGTEVSILDDFTRNVGIRGKSFASLLPSHIKVEKFQRVLVTAVQQNPKLLDADRETLWNAAMKAAKDGLIPDGREAALVTFKTKQKDASGREVWVEAVQYMPMMAGVLKMVRNSGELLSLNASVIRKDDEFDFWTDENGQHLKHRPKFGGGGDAIGVYAIAKIKGGGIYIEVMTQAEVDKVRAVSRSADSGPWAKWPDEMAKKSAIRRLAKRLPMSTDLDEFIRQDDAMYDLDRQQERAPERDVTPASQKARSGGVSRLDEVRSQGPAIEHLPGEPGDDGRNETDPI